MSLFKETFEKKGSFISSIKAVFAVPSFIKEHEGVLKYFILPFILNVIVLTAVFYFSFTSIKPWLYGKLTGTGWFFDTLRVIIGPILIIVLGFITIIIYSIVGAIVTAPFNDFLSAAVEVKGYGATFDEPFSMKAFGADILRAIKNNIKLLALMILINIGLLLLNFIPLLGQILSSVLGFFVTSFYLGFQFFDYPLERRRLTFREKLRVCLKFPRVVMGVGSSFFVLSFIPIVGFLGLSAGTIAGTTQFVECMQPALEDEMGLARRPQ